MQLGTRHEAALIWLEIGRGPNGDSMPFASLKYADLLKSPSYFPVRK
jgi:hypothetical protein